MLPYEQSFHNFCSFFLSQICVLLMSLLFQCIPFLRLQTKTEFHIAIIAIIGVLWPSGLVRWTQVLALSECGFESQPGRSRLLCP